MSRGNVRVREAGIDDIDALVALHEELLAATNRRSAGMSPAAADPDQVPQRYTALLEDPAITVLLAVDGSTEEILGMVALQADPMTGAIGLPALSMHQFVIDRRHRRRGAGRALVTAATGYADRLGYENLIVGVATDGREAHRYFARLGFVPLVTRRVAAVATLRRTLGIGEAIEARVRRRARPRLAPVRRGSTLMAATQTVNRRPVAAPGRHRAG